MARRPIVKTTVEWQVDNFMQKVGASINQSLHNSAQDVKKEIFSSFRTAKTGREYPHPSGGTYTASAAGEPPAYRTGDYQDSFYTRIDKETKTRTSAVIGTDYKTKSGHWLGIMLEFGTSKMEPRPHLLPALMRSKDKILAHFR